jgi:threonine dehydratase
MILPVREEFERARERLAGVIVRTPLVPLADDEPDSEIWLKPETLQPVKSFKLRGVFAAASALDHEVRARGLSTVSAGNTAQALAWTARWFGVRCRSLMPETAPQTKIDAVRRLGGEPVLVPPAELFRFLRERGWEREVQAFIHPWTDRNLMIGHGTIGLELAEDLPRADTIYVPVGGGGLIAGVAAACRVAGLLARVVGVEPQTCPKLQESLRLGRPADVDCRTALCDGVAVPRIADEMFPLLRELVAEVLLVPEADVAAAIRRLALQDRLIVEGAGALALAAALATPPRLRGRTVCLLTGGSIDREKLLGLLA